ncbi:multidrug effflux MFS transporter [Pendulispora brunnea]|uniref:Multidrug effflux MFS transporter n=1 Tax=Pendulispora brunnea TaxID=2905690 RepID=A0ABZ2JZS3_9BACT
MSALIAITALAIDMSLPAQPTLVREFRTISDHAQLTLSVFLMGYAMGQPIAGYLADARGRRGVLLTGLVVFSLAGFACAASTSLRLLIAWRFVQGLGAASGTVVAQAMVRDTHTEAGAARVFARMIAILALAPTLAPLVGGQLLAYAGWRAIFVTLGLCGAVLAALSALTLNETLEARHPPSLGGMATGMLQFVRTPATRLPACIVALSFACQFAFISASPFVLLEGYRVHPSHFAIYFGATAVALMLGSAWGARLLGKGLAPRHVVAFGAYALLGGGLLALALVHAPATGALGLVLPMLACFFGLGLMSPSATAMAMAPVPAIAGTASAILGLLEMSAGSLSGYLNAKIGGADARILALQIACLAVACTAITFAMRETGKGQTRL